MNISDDKKYPLGKFEPDEKISDTATDLYVEVIKNFPGKLKLLVENWNEQQLDTQYRDGGWTVRQLINHLSDSHMQNLGRVKMALTEGNPVIKPYDEAKWAELQDSRNEPVKSALLILEGLHSRWVHLLKSITNIEFERTYFHPEQQKSVTIRENIAFYAWHCDHHFAHIDNLRKERGWA